MRITIVVELSDAAVEAAKRHWFEEPDLDDETLKIGVLDTVRDLLADDFRRAGFDTPIRDGHLVVERRTL